MHSIGFFLRRILSVYELGMGTDINSKQVLWVISNHELHREKYFTISQLNTPSTTQHYIFRKTSAILIRPLHFRDVS